MTDEEREVLRVHLAFLRTAWESGVLALDNHGALDGLEEPVATAISDDWDDVNFHLEELEKLLGVAQVEKQPFGVVAGPEWQNAKDCL